MNDLYIYFSQIDNCIAITFLVVGFFCANLSYYTFNLVAQRNTQMTTWEAMRAYGGGGLALINGMLFFGCFMTFENVRNLLGLFMLDGLVYWFSGGVQKVLLFIIGALR